MLLVLPALPAGQRARLSPPPRGGRAAAGDAAWHRTRGGHHPCRLPGMPHQGCGCCCSGIAPRREGAPGRSAARRRPGFEGKGEVMWSQIFRRHSKRAGCSGSWVPGATTCRLSPQAPVVAGPRARCRACQPSITLPWAVAGERVLAGVESPHSRLEYATWRQ